MTETKTATLIIKVDLSDKSSYKKIQKILCDLQIPEGIKSISYDDKKNTVTISGPFDPDKLTKKLYKEACKVCLCIEITRPAPPKPEPPKPPPPEPCKVINCIKITVGGHKVDCPMVKCKCKKPPKCKECEPPKCKECKECEPPKCKECEPCHRPGCPVCCCGTYCCVGGHGASCCSSCGKKC